MKRVAVLTSGGDAPGMNACIRAITLTAQHFNIDTIGYRNGYNGLLEQDYMTLNADSVSRIVHQGGTMLRSARCLPFKSKAGAQQACHNLNDLNIDGLIVIGGDGSMQGVNHLCQLWDKPVLALPGTIDNDIPGTDNSIGFHTAIDTALNSIDKVRDTADAFERIFLVEVMGRHAGFIALAAAVGAGADYTLLPEIHNTEEKILNSVVDFIAQARQHRSNASYVIVSAENLWQGGATALAQTIQNEVGTNCHPVILGHVQRGGSPVVHDRLLATKLGAFAIECLRDGISNCILGEVGGELLATPIPSLATEAKQLDPTLIKLQLNYLT